MRSWQLDRRLGSAIVAGIAMLSSLACGSGAQEAGQGGLARTPRSSAITATAAVCTGTGSHDKHAAYGIGCAVCHPCGGAYQFDAFTYTRGTSTSGGTITLTGTDPATCSVACHFPMGTQPHSITWGTPGPLDCTSCHAVAALPSVHPTLVVQNPTRADCEACHRMGEHTKGTVVLVSHGVDWMNSASSGFHAYSANARIASCQACHGADLTGGSTSTGCRDCHDRNLPTGVTSWRTNCVMCHGDKATGQSSPPRATWGNNVPSDTANVRIGAHAAHLTGSAIAPPFDCAVCHVKPTDALSDGHVDEATAKVVFSGLAANRGEPAAAWSRDTGTCSSTYCHGATLGGGTNKSPTWTRVGQGEAGCGTCHGLPPPAPHPSVSGGLSGCAVCHSDTVDSSGALIPPSAGGLHLDGFVEGGHDKDWMDKTSTKFHAYSANRGLGPCQACHGADLSGGATQVGCAKCHGAGWERNCTMCHGDPADGTGAPPRTTWGNSGDPLRVGAHTAHVKGTSVAAPLDCDQCHVVPADAFSPGHIDDAAAKLTWGSLATVGGAAPAWDRTAGTCASTYCHGNYAGTFSYYYWDGTYDARYAGKRATPSWTGSPTACDSCHGNPPRENLSWHGYHNGGNQCQLCHPDAIGTVAGVGIGITNRARHANGVVDVEPQWDAQCFNCH
ncbi:MULTISPECIES: CxxxxCH/CxxCH domain c-type cytochrome [Anaeromyxobacter]|uniref:CxxxxCH/CxxCH domain c-type cytochrome n=1 Tax=Anaeromyxobacter TaxID=161492 RepID=UPI001F57A4D2|nr:MULTISPECIES: CxxxxCH/CxxCH domain-containing protein [unclassified Anaeromyxobacter]